MSKYHAASRLGITGAQGLQSECLVWPLHLLWYVDLTEQNPMAEAVNLQMQSARRRGKASSVQEREVLVPLNIGAEKTIY